MSWVTPEIVARRFSSGSATVAAMISGAAPAMVACTTTTGKVMLGSGATGRWNQASTPDRKIATASKVVATGRSMKRAERFTSASRPAVRSAGGG